MLERISGERAWRRVRRTLTSTVPAAGADPTHTITGGHIFEIVSIFASLVTSAAVANRSPRLIVTDGVATILEVPPSAVVAAGLTRTFSWGVGLITGNAGTAQAIAIPRLFLPAGSVVSLSTEAIDVADQWSAINLWGISTQVMGASENLADLPDFIAEMLASSPT